MHSPASTSLCAQCAAVSSEWGRMAGPSPLHSSSRGLYDSGMTHARSHIRSLFDLNFRPMCSREFGHRVKGISVSRFTPEEAAALEEGGNGVRRREFRVQGRTMEWWGAPAARALRCPPLSDAQAFAAEYLATWQASTLPKPTNRVPAKIKEWIQVVFQEQRFRGPPKKASSPQQRAPSLGQEAKPALFKTPSAGRSPAPLSTSNGNVSS